MFLPIQRGKRPFSQGLLSTMRATSRPVPRISGTIRAPGDKSCSHRAVMMAAVAEGTTTVTGLLEGEDVLNTAKAVKTLGAGVERLGPGEWRIQGVGRQGFSHPAGDLDFGNSGTGARLMMGLVGGHDVTARFTGDASLSSRPMERVLKPLREMGVRAETAPGGRLPAIIHGGNLKAIRYAPPEASAQVKSAILLAGLRAEGVTVVEEKEATRDHTERMLAAFGVSVGLERRIGAGPVVSLRGRQPLRGGFAAAVAGDPSSAAFAVAAVVVAAEGEAVVVGMLDNRTRTGFIDAAREMGAQIRSEEDGSATGEETIRVIARASRLKGITLDPALVPSMIDELPIFAVLAAFADGKTKVTGAAELRVKESDRIKAICAMLAVNGVDVEELPDGFVVTGRGPLGVPGGGTVETRHDHRIAMSALVMGTAAKQPVAVDDIAMIATSYPEFFDHMAALGADVARA
jgi:3-phosphoshikimate 1-carboxyvinyltransferase